MPEIPQKYFPKGIGPGSFDLELMRAAAKSCNHAVISTNVEVKPWVLLWLLDCFETLEEITDDLGHPSHQDKSWVAAMEVLGKDVDGAIEGWSS